MLSVHFFLPSLSASLRDFIFIIFTHILYFYLFIFNILIIYEVSDSVALLVRRTAHQRRMQQVVLGVVWIQLVHPLRMSAYVVREREVHLLAVS